MCNSDDILNILHIGCYCIKGLKCSLPLQLLIFSYVWWLSLLLCKYEPFGQEVSFEFLLLRWPLNPMCLLFKSPVNSIYLSNFHRQNAHNDKSTPNNDKSTSDNDKSTPHNGKSTPYNDKQRHTYHIMSKAHPIMTNAHNVKRTPHNDNSTSDKDKITQHNGKSTLHTYKSTPNTYKSTPHNDKSISHNENKGHQIKTKAHHIMAKEPHITIF